MLRAACHLETPEGGGRRKGKVGAVHAGSGVGGVKGREEGTEGVALGSGGERPAGARLGGSVVPGRGQRNPSGFVGRERGGALKGRELPLSPRPATTSTFL